MDQTSAIVVSILMEAWEVVRAGLVEDGTVKDVRQDLAHVPDLIFKFVHRYCTVCQFLPTRSVIFRICETSWPFMAQLCAY